MSTANNRPSAGRIRASTHVPVVSQSLAKNAKGTPAPPTPSLEAHIPAATSTSSASASLGMEDLVALLRRHPSSSSSVQHAQALARAFAVARQHHSPLPPQSDVFLVLVVLFSADSPAPAQSAGAEICAAYAVEKLDDVERRAWVDLVAGCDKPTIERVQALQALLCTREVVGLEHTIRRVLPSWVHTSLVGEPNAIPVAVKAADVLKTTLGTNRALFSDEDLNKIQQPLVTGLSALLEGPLQFLPSIVHATRPSAPSRSTSFHKRSSSSLTQLPFQTELPTPVHAHAHSTFPHHHQPPSAAAARIEAATSILCGFVQAFLPLRDQTPLDDALGVVAKAVGVFVMSGTIRPLPSVTVDPPEKLDCPEVEQAVESLLLKLVQNKLTMRVVRVLHSLLASSMTDEATAVGALRLLRIPATHTTRRRIAHMRMDDGAAQSHTMTGVASDLDDAVLEAYVREDAWSGAREDGWEVGHPDVAAAVARWLAPEEGGLQRLPVEFLQETADWLKDVCAEADFFAQHHNQHASGESLVWDFEARETYGGVLKELVRCLPVVSITLAAQPWGSTSSLVLPILKTDPPLPNPFLLSPPPPLHTSSPTSASTFTPSPGHSNSSSTLSSSYTVSACLKLLHALTHLLSRPLDQRPSLEPPLSTILLSETCAPYLSDSMFENLIQHLEVSGGLRWYSPDWLKTFELFFRATAPPEATRTPSMYAAAVAKLSPRRKYLVARTNRAAHEDLRCADRREERHEFMKLIVTYWSGLIDRIDVVPASTMDQEALRESLQIMRDEVAIEAFSVGDADFAQRQNAAAAAVTLATPEVQEAVAATDATEDTTPAAANNVTQVELEVPTPPPESEPTPQPWVTLLEPEPETITRPAPAHQDETLLPPLARGMLTVLLRAARSCDGSCSHPHAHPDVLSRHTSLSSESSHGISRHSSLSSPASLGLGYGGSMGGWTAAGAFSPALSSAGSSSSASVMSPTTILSIQPPTLSIPPREKEREREKDRGGDGVSRIMGTIFRFASGSVAPTPVRETPPSTASTSTTASSMNTPGGQSDLATPTLDATPVLATGTESGAPIACKAVAATISLVNLFVELAFAPNPPHRVVVRLYSLLVGLLARRFSQRQEEGSGQAAPTHLPSMRCPKAQLVLLNFLMRMRADRDHQIYISSTEAVDNETRGLAGLLKRTAQSSGAGTGRPLHQEQPPNQNHGAGPHVQFQPQQHPHTNPRGRHSDRDKESSSRSRSRPPPKQEPSPRIVPSNPSGGVPPLPLVESPMLWGVPERSPFDLPGSALPKDGIQTHIPGTTVDAEPVVLQINKYLSVLVDIIDSKEGHAQDDDREVVSYVLCHLPAQLSNKHFFCGPRTKSEVARLIETMCRAIERDEFSRVARGSGGMLRPWDVNAVAYHTLQVLVSYRTSFDSRRAQDRLINTFVKGLIPHSPTAKPCLDALTLCAFDLTNSLSRHLSTIVVKLAQIMSNTAVAVHILDFLGFIVTKPLLFANFTQDEHKLVFGVVLQYLVVHNRQQPDSHSEERSWALSQHVLVYTYYVLYTLVLALPVGERKSYVPYITKQLLQAQAQSDGANGSASTIDERTEVAFDWLARYTYASTDPKPARSFLRSLVMPRHQPLSDPSNPAASAYRSTSDDFDENSGGETYVFSTSILTIRSTERTGWVDVDIRRPSGRTSFLCRVENVPLAGLGEHDPDLVSESAELMMNRDPEWMKAARFPDIDDNKHTPTPSLATGLEEPSANEVDDNLTEAISAPLAAPAARPHSTTGYVWSGSAPSQRRKDVIMHPEFTLLQLSQYPNGFDWSALHASKYQRLGSAIRTLDRMPVIETHMIGVLYVAPGQTKERDILSNEHGSPAYSRFMSGLARLVRVAGQRDIYIGGLDSSDGEFAYAWWDDIGQILYHTATLIPNDDEMDHSRARKKRNLGNSHVKIIWNDSGKPFAFHTIPTAFQFVNIVIEPHSRGTVAAYSDNQHENEYFRVTLQRVEGMPRFDPVGEYKIVCAESLPEYVRQLGLLSDFFSRVWETTQADSQENDIITNWRHRLQRIRRLWKEVKEFHEEEQNEGRMRLRRDGEEGRRDFTLFAGGVPPENIQN